jgi:hypothetical protein
MLRAAYKHGNDYAPMWYPLLTLQILNQSLYRNGRGLTISDFFYPSPSDDGGGLLSLKEKFYGELFYHSMWREAPMSRPVGTIPSPGDLRAISIEPVPAEKPAEVFTEESKPRDGRLRRTGRFVARLAMIFIVETFVRGRRKAGQQKKKKEEDKPSSLLDRYEKQRDEFWTPILFYDTAGESQERVSPVTRAVRQLTNKLAICIDAREIFDRYESLSPDEPATPIGARNASIRHAYKRINEMAMARSNRKETCIVVTKLDLVLSGDEKDRVRAIAEDPSKDEEARALLIKWLKDHADDRKRDLLSFLPRSGLVGRVFFVWTENLPRMSGIRHSPIRKIEPPAAECGDTVTMEANDGFDFNDVNRVTFNGVEGSFKIVSEKQLTAVVPDGASSGFIGILLKGEKKSTVGSPIPYVDDATSDMVFEVRPGKGNDAARPRSYGLIKFLAWCLDKKVEEIARPTDDH